MLQTIYEGESSFPADTLVGQQRLPTQHKMHHGNGSVDVKPEVPLALKSASPLDLRTDPRMLAPGSDPGAWERQLQQEILLIQKQQQIQKQLLISEFQKQHENLTRQHQAQLQEHLKLQQELQTMKQQQEVLEKERRLEQQSQEKEQERHRREQQVLRSKEHARESAIASTEVKQKLQEFLLSKSAKDSTCNGASHSLIHHPKLWYTSSHYSSLDQSSPPLGGNSPCKLALPYCQEDKEDFPLRKTASEPNLKVRSRLKQKVAERRSSPLLKRKEGTVMTPYKKRAIDLLDSTPSTSAPGSGPSSPIGASSALGALNGPSSLPTTTQTERWPSQPRLFQPEGSVSMLNLYTSPSLPNITLALPAASSPRSAAVGLKEKARESGALATVRHGLTAHLLGTMPLQQSLETKVSPSHQALLQHLLQKEQMRQQKMLSSGQSSVPARPHSPLATKDRPKLPRHRPLNRTQSAPLPQNTLAQLVIQQQHQHFLEKQKQYQQQIHINQMLSKSIEQLRQPNTHLPESEEEDIKAQTIEEDKLPPGGVIRKNSPSYTRSSSSELAGTHSRVIKVKEEPVESEDEGLVKQILVTEQSSYLSQVKGRLVIRAMI